MDKQFGKGSVLLLGSKNALPVTVISSGSLAIDAALGVGGFPRGRVVEIFGPESSGKTTLTLHLIAEAGLWDEIDYFLIYSREHYFAVEMLLALGIRSEQIIDVQSATHLRAERLVVTSPVRGTGRHAPRWAGTFLKDAFRPLANEAARSARFSPLVYVSRRDAAFRRVRNEAEVEALLAGFGFESYALTELSFREKAALFSGARAVVGPVGAGLANIMFCAAGTPLIELLPHNLVVPDYLDLTARLDMPHYPLICAREAESAHRATADRQDDLTVDLDALRLTVQLALGQAVPA